MIDGEFFQLLGIVLFAAAVCASLARVARLPTIVSYLIAGILVGPVLHLVQSPDAIHDVAEMGIVLLLFLVGLELSFSEIRDVGKVALLAGIGQVVFTAAGGMILCLFLGFGWMDSLFLSVALTFSSTVVVVKILTDKGEMCRLYGRIAVGIFLVQDLVVMVVLTVLTGLGKGDGEGGAMELAAGIGRAFAGMALLLGAVLAASRWVLPRLFAKVAGSAPTLFIWSLGWCFAVVALAKWLELSIELGAFFAGLSLAQLPYNRDLQHRIKPLMNFFIAVFFVSLGVGVTPGDFTTNWWPVLVLSLFVLIGNPLFFFWIIARMGYSERTSFLAGVTVAQVSEFSFVFVAMGTAAGLVGSAVLPITMFVGIITIAASAYLILYNGPIYEWFRRLDVLRFLVRATGKDDGREPEILRDHVLVVGMNSLGRRIVRELCTRGETVLALDTDSKKLEGLPCRTLCGNAEYLDVLMDAGLQQAKLLVSALRIEEANDLLAYRCREARVPCSIHAVDLSVMDNLLDLEASYVMLPKVDGVKTQRQLLKQRGILPG